MSVVIDQSRRLEGIKYGVNRELVKLGESLEISVYVGEQLCADTLSWTMFETPPPFGRVAISTKVSLSLLALRADKLVALYLEEVKGRSRDPDHKRDIFLACNLHHATGCPVTYWTNLSIPEAEELLPVSESNPTLGYNEAGTLVNAIHIGYPITRRWLWFFQK